MRDVEEKRENAKKIYTVNPEYLVEIKKKYNINYAVSPNPVKLTELQLIFNNEKYWLYYLD